MSYSPIHQLNSILGRRTFTGREDEGPEEAAKRARADIPKNLILRTLTNDLLQNVMEYNGSLDASRVSRDFNSANGEALKRVCSEMLTRFREEDELEVAPFLPAADQNLTEFQTTKILFDKMTGELAILDPKKLRELSPKTRKFDPKLYIEMAQHLKQIHDSALTASWPKILHAINQELRENENPQMPPIQASAGAIRAWISSPANRIFVRRIHTLNLKNLRLPVIPKEIKFFKNLQSLNLSLNKIQGIQSSTFKGLFRLRRVDLSENQLNQLPEDLLVDNQLLENFFMKQNRLRQIPENLFSGLSFLEIVQFDDNQIEQIPTTLFTDCNNLVGFYISNNLLTEIPEDLFAQIDTSLEYVDFGNNLIREIPPILFNETQELRSAIFYRNQIKNIQEDLFSECFDLQYLDLSENLIESICPELCENCVVFPNLYLADNPITEEPNGYFRRFNHVSGGLFEA